MVGRVKLPIFVLSGLALLALLLSRQPTKPRGDEQASAAATTRSTSSPPPGGNPTAPADQSTTSGARQSFAPRVERPQLASAAKLESEAIDRYVRLADEGADEDTLINEFFRSLVAPRARACLSALRARDRSVQYHYVFARHPEGTGEEWTVLEEDGVTVSDSRHLPSDAAETALRCMRESIDGLVLRLPPQEEDMPEYHVFYSWKLSPPSPDGE